MNRTIATLTTVAALALGGTAFAQTSPTMSEGYDMLQTALMSDFERMGIPTEELENLTLGQIAAIKAVLESSDNEGQQKGQVEAIIAQ